MYRFHGSRKTIVVISDILLLAMGMCGAFYLRFESRLPPQQITNLIVWTPAAIFIRLTMFYLFGLYSSVWRYASSNDLLNIVKAVFSGTIAFVIAVVFARGLVGFPRSVFIIEFLITLFLIGGLRFSLRVYRELFPVRKAGSQKRILIIGAGDAGNALLKEIHANSNINYKVMGFIDDNKAKQKIRLHGVPVLGTRHDIVNIVENKCVDEIIIAIPSASRRQISELIDICRQGSSKVKVLPHLGDLINGRVSVNNIREVQIEDLLGRDIVDIDTELIKKYLANKRVLISGAGGSIGSEIARQVLKFHPGFIALLGRGEQSIYEIAGELARRPNGTSFAQIIGGTGSRKKLDKLFEKYKPDIVFHAGADKHVPLLESNPEEAVLNNVFGTRNLIEAAEKYGSEKVVCISTDKAADPVSVMGAAKRLAEMIIQSRKSTKTKTIAVRFGNVLGSRGSVIPLFKKQISAGGPVTVTHPDMVRYFMTIPEAAQLVLQAGAIGGCGEIFLLDMGNPVKIVDLANQMIRLSGFEPGADIEVKFTGLRPGERLVESLMGKDERLVKSIHPKIFKLELLNGFSKLDENDLTELHNLAIEMDEPALRNKLKSVVPNSFN